MKMMKTWDDEAQEIELRNAQGLSVRLSNYGARILGIQVPLHGESEKREVVVGLPTLAQNKKDAYFGGTVGPLAGRTAKGIVTIEGQCYQLEQNEGENTCHNGHDNLSRKMWDIIEFSDNQVSFLYRSPDGEFGLPGTQKFILRYTLRENGELALHYYGWTDLPTVYNPTNHVYFNLNGSAQTSVADHWLQVIADSYWRLTDENLPAFESAVKDTPFDFNNGKQLRSILIAEDQQIRLNQGLNHPFILKELKDPQVVLVSGDQRVKVSMTTSQEAVIVYTTGAYQKGYETNTGQLCHGGGLALEAQMLPNQAADNLLMTPERPYHSQTTYRIEAV